MLEEGARVVAIERDARCLPALAELAAAYPGRLEVIAGDALAIDAASLGAPPRRIVANLPYNIGTPLLLAWLARPDAFESLTIMLQKEVVERLTAAPGTRAWGRLAIAAQWRWRAERAFDVPAAAFVPPPKVTSSVARLGPRAAPLAPAEPVALERVVAAAFGQRRKMLRAALRALTPQAEALLESAGIAPTRRAETLTIEEFCALARGFVAATGPRAAP